MKQIDQSVKSIQMDTPFKYLWCLVSSCSGQLSSELLIRFVLFHVIWRPAEIAGFRLQEPPGFAAVDACLAQL